MQLMTANIIPAPNVMFNSDLSKFCC